jgi:hypothetical protein
MADDTIVPPTFGLVIEAETPAPKGGAKSLKGLGYLWPKIYPPMAKQIRQLAKRAGKDTKKGHHEIARQLIAFALANTTIKK